MNLGRSPGSLEAALCCFKRQVRVGPCCGRACPSNLAPGIYVLPRCCPTWTLSLHGKLDQARSPSLTLDSRSSLAALPQPRLSSPSSSSRPPSKRPRCASPPPQSSLPSPLAPRPCPRMSSPSARSRTVRSRSVKPHPINIRLFIHGTMLTCTRPRLLLSPALVTVARPRLRLVSEVNIRTFHDEC